MDDVVAVNSEAIRPETVADRIAGVLREAISGGELRGGVALRQDELAARFGFSRMPVRDALRLLESEGLVTIHPTRGAFVARLDAKEIAEIYSIRSLLETEALRLSCERLTTADLDKAATLLAQIDAEMDVGRWGALNKQFHMTLYGACQNERLIGLIATHHDAADRYVRVLLSSLGYEQQSQDEHRALLKACRDRNIDAAIAILQGHLLEGTRKLSTAAQSS
ncbi:GntR family transcriptional regulator [Agrobacterium pusense]|uniref:GntR family transcriptional regulator n=1 Tax=Agrobacterium pusense TaxID=648995 RepID=UPI0007D8842E|nr:GntR family transcriptional regulator [Agrobacterium pusense]OAI83057.1 GntR family transcriptional regulator [Rhizobium sp. GHKF11]